MEGGTTTEQALFYGRSSGTNYHLFHADQHQSVCGYYTLPDDMPAQVTRQKLHAFTGFDSKPPNKWCQHCREAIDQ